MNFLKKFLNICFLFSFSFLVIGEPGLLSFMSAPILFSFLLAFLFLNEPKVKKKRNVRTKERKERSSRDRSCGTSCVPDLVIVGFRPTVGHDTAGFLDGHTSFLCTSEPVIWRPWRPRSYEEDVLYRLFVFYFFFHISGQALGPIVMTAWKKKWKQGTARSRLLWFRRSSCLLPTDGSSLSLCNMPSVG